MTSIAVMGAGLIGRLHIRHVLQNPDCTLAAIVDPAPEAEALAETHATPWYPNLAAMLADHKPDGVIVATPNQLHVAHGLACVAAGIPVLVEKPIADHLEAAAHLVAAAEAAHVPMLVGHHRRHNPIIQAARRTIQNGELGEILSVHTHCWFTKPAGYFAPAWRRQPGAGPILLNLIHDIDVLRYLLGEITQIQAMQSKTHRGHEVEDTAVILLGFQSGALGTVTVSDAIAAPWSWEFTSGENPDYTQTDQACTLIGGTKASLAVPTLALWEHTPAPDWWNPIHARPIPVTTADPFALQLQNFHDVIHGTAAPIMPGREGLATLRVIAAIAQAAQFGQRVTLPPR